jgi:hypothetical protein
MTPEHHQHAISQAGSAVMRDASSRLDQATHATRHHADELAALIGSARQQDKQLRWLAVTGAAALIVGLLMSPFLARLLPFGWDAGVAVSILRADRWHAGIALLKSANPEGWETLASEINLLVPNHAALTACREAAAREKKDQHCTVIVPAPSSSVRAATQ